MGVLQPLPIGLLQQIQISNWNYFELQMGTSKTPSMYRNAQEVYEALVDFVMKRGVVHMAFIPYKCKPKLIDGDCIFSLVSNTNEAVTYEFRSTVS